MRNIYEKTLQNEVLKTNFGLLPDIYFNLVLKNRN
nr:MAG TPA: Cd27 binding protein [Caudoviricetes sp.]